MTDRDPPLATNRGTIGGTVNQDSPVTPIAGAYALTVNSSTGVAEAGVVANGSGVYSTPNLRAGNYWMVHLDPTGAHRPEFFPDATDVTGATTLAVTAGATTTANGALATQTAVATGSTLTGTIRETGTNTLLPGVMVVALRSSDFRMARATTTNASGQYSLNVVAGGYHLAFIDSAGLHSMEFHNNQPGSGLGTSTVVTAPAVTDATLDRSTGSISGTVTDDVSNAAVGSAWVFAIGASGPVAGTVSAVNGTYTIGGLPIGSYRVTFVDPAGGRTQEYYNNSPDYAGSVPVVVNGGATTANINAALHKP